MRITVILALSAVTLAQFQDNRVSNDRLPCGFSCSRRTSVLTMVDGVFSRAECSDKNANVQMRCSSCCAMKALSEGLSTDRSTGLPSITGGDCICCFNNNQC